MAWANHVHGSWRAPAYGGRSVIICAGDTFRAAAADQLTVWAERADVPIVKQAEGADPAAVVFDGVQAAKSRFADVLIVDTAGRLHNKTHLMEELKKISRVVSREYPEAAVKALLVLDATTGQNGLQQAMVFRDVANIDGLILTKLDGTAKGGIAIAIRQELGLPVRYIGVGEQIDDLQPFNAREFIDANFLGGIPYEKQADYRGRPGSLWQRFGGNVGGKWLRSDGHRHQ